MIEFVYRKPKLVENYSQGDGRSATYSKCIHHVLLPTFS